MNNMITNIKNVLVVIFCIALTAFGFTRSYNALAIWIISIIAWLAFDVVEVLLNINKTE